MRCHECFFFIPDKKLLNENRLLPQYISSMLNRLVASIYLECLFLRHSDLDNLKPPIEAQFCMSDDF